MISSSRSSSETFSTSTEEGGHDEVLPEGTEGCARGLRYVCVEKDVLANTIANFPEGKWVYAEPDTVPAKGKLWLDGATKEDLIERWQQIVDDNALDVRVEEPLTALPLG